MQKNQGFSIVELLLVCSIVIFLSGFIFINLLGSQHKTSLTAVYDQIKADMAHVRLQSFSGYQATESMGGAHGIHFDQHQYVLFNGSTYLDDNSTNTVVSLPSNIQFSSIAFSGSTIVFATGSGEIVSFDPVNNFIVLTEINSQEAKTITLNALGTMVAN